LGVFYLNNAALLVKRGVILAGVLLLRFTSISRKPMIIALCIRMIISLDHIQLALPAGAEDLLRPFYALLGLTEVLKPAPLVGRGGFWMRAGNLSVHFGVDPTFAPATKAHPAFVVSDIDHLAERLVAAGYDISWDTKLVDVRRFFVFDPVGNRIELIAS
jgi:hypothetical protein